VSDFYDKAGKRLDLIAWARLREKLEYRLVGHFQDERVEILTLWMGIDRDWEKTGPPLIFETSIHVFPGSDVAPEFDGERYYWRTEKEAKEGHEVVVACYRDGIHPDFPVRAVREKYSSPAQETLQ